MVKNLFSNDATEHDQQFIKVIPDREMLRSRINIAWGRSMDRGRKLFDDVQLEPSISVRIQ